jgi:hypothetical protein
MIMRRAIHQLVMIATDLAGENRSGVRPGGLHGRKS